MTATQNHPDPPGPDAMAPDAMTPDAVTTVSGSGSGQPDAPGSPNAPRNVPRSRMGGMWVTLVVAAFVLLLLLIFILQNGQPAQVSFLGAHGELPMGVALLLAAIFGVLLVALPGTARILQLRALGRRAPGAASAAGPPAAAHRRSEGQ